MGFWFEIVVIALLIAILSYLHKLFWVVKNIDERDEAVMLKEIATRNANRRSFP